MRLTSGPDAPRLQESAVARTTGHPAPIRIGRQVYMASGPEAAAFNATPTPDMRPGQRPQPQRG
jgi:hypothetical protein